MKQVSTVNKRLFLMLAIFIFIPPALYSREDFLQFRNIQFYSHTKGVFKTDDFFSESKNTEDNDANAFSAEGINVSSIKINFSGLAYILAADTASSSIQNLFQVDFNTLSFTQKCSLIQETFSFNQGLSFSTEDFLPETRLSVLAGNIKFSGARSRMKNPRLSSVSSLSRFSSIVNGFNPSLPSADSGVSLPAAAIVLKPDSKDSLLPVIQIGASADIFSSEPVLNQMIFSIYKDFSTKLFPKASAGFSAGTFRHQNDSSLWFTDFPRYGSSLYPAAEFSLSLITAFFRTTDAAGFIKQPFDSETVLIPSCGTYFQSKNSFYAGTFCINTGLFISDGGSVLIEGNYFRTFFQYYLNPQISFTVKNAPVKAGLLVSGEYKRKAYDDSQSQNEYKIRSDISVVNDHFTAASSLQFNISDMEKFSLAASVRCSGSFTGFSLNQNISCTTDFSSYTISSSLKMLFYQLKDFSFTSSSSLKFHSQSADSFSFCTSVLYKSEIAEKIPLSIKITVQLSISP